MVVKVSKLISNHFSVLNRYINCSNKMLNIFTALCKDIKGFCHTCRDFISGHIYKFNFFLNCICLCKLVLYGIGCISCTVGYVRHS